MKIFPDNLLEPEDLTALDPLEDFAFSKWKADPNLRHAFTAKGCKPLCQYPELGHESSFSPSQVTCLNCGLAWYYLVSGLCKTLKDRGIHWRRSALKTLLDYAACDRECCVGCDHWLDNWTKDFK